MLLLCDANNVRDESKRGFDDTKKKQRFEGGRNVW